MTEPNWLTREQTIRAFENLREMLKAQGRDYMALDKLEQMALYAIEAKEREAKPCGECGGEGKIGGVPKDAPRLASSFVWFECPACNGTGRKP